jgi:hypothetical protein
MSDPRFARLKSDPRFRRPKKKLTKVVVDERFKSVFAKEKKNNSTFFLFEWVYLLTYLTGPKVDKYGRPVSETQEQDDLKRFYRLNDSSDDDEDEEPKKHDLARGEVLLESSDEEDEKEQAEAYANNHQEEEKTQEAPRTARLAIVNLDWDHVRARHLYKICASLVSPTAPRVRASTSSLEKRTSHHQKSEGAGQNVVQGKVLSVRIYPSDFGKERMAREEKEGPPSEIFKNKNLAAEEVDEKNVYDVGGEDNYDEDALRQYQLERLRQKFSLSLSLQLLLLKIPSDIIMLS